MLPFACCVCCEDLLCWHQFVLCSMSRCVWAHLSHLSPLSSPVILLGGCYIALSWLAATPLASLLAVGMANIVLTVDVVVSLHVIVMLLPLLATALACKHLLRAVRNVASWLGAVFSSLPVGQCTAVITLVGLRLVSRGYDVGVSI